MIAPEIKELTCFKYAEEVLEGKITAGELIKLACKRFIDDLNRDDLEFRFEIGKKFVKFASIIKHFKGRSTGKQFILQPWQEFIVFNILCFYWKDTNTRRFTSSLIFISRKQGKTALAALFCIWFLLFDNEGSPEVDLSANSLQQANVAFEFVENFCRQLDPKEKDLKFYRKQIKSKFNSGVINVFASDSTKLDGFNSSFTLVDEYGAAKDSKMYDVLKSSMGQRENPHIMTISTAGFDLSNPLHEMFEVDSDILRGLKSDDSHFCMLFSLDPDDNYADPKVWDKISPNLNITVNEKFLEDEVNRAKNNPSAEIGILTKTFNQWCSSSTTWIQNTFIQKISRDIAWDDFNENDFCFVGVDLAAVSDLTVLSFLFSKDDDDKLYFKNIYYLPEFTMLHSPNRESYRKWRNEKLLNITPGNVVDYDFILTDLMKHTQNYCLQKISYDPWNSTQFVINATNAGLPMYPCSQSITNLTKPAKTLERLIKLEKIVIDNSEINRWCFQNAAPKYDWNDNLKIIKGGGKDQKIDGVVAMLNALSGYLSQPIGSAKITII